MAEQQTTSEQQSSSEQTQQQSSSPSLDDVYKQFNVEEAASSFNPQREQKQEQSQRQTQQTPVAVPDPVLDPNGYKTWAGNQHQLLQDALSKVEGQLNSMTVERIRQREEADIKSAVQQFQSVAGEDVDPDLAEIALGHRARKDPKFLAVWQNRGKNPAAFKAAVSALASEFKSKNMMKVDPQIAENQRAAKNSIGSQTKSRADEPAGDDKRFVNKSGREFEQEWRRYVDSSY